MKILFHKTQAIGQTYYIEEDEAFTFELGHYFRSLNLVGPGFSRSFDQELLDEIKENQDQFLLALSMEDLEALFLLGEEVSELKYGIEKGDKRYLKGLEIRAQAEKIFDKLSGPSYQALEEQVIQETLNSLKERFHLSQEIAEEIFKKRPDEDYLDPDIVMEVYSSASDLGAYHLENVFFSEIPDFVGKHINLEGLGLDYADHSETMEILSNRQIVEYVI